MEKKIIVYVCESLGGGVRKHLVDLLENIDRSKFELHVIHGVNRMDSVFIEAKNKINDIKFYPVNEMEREINIIKDSKALLKTINIMKVIKPNIVHCHSSKAGFIGRVAAKYLKVKNVFYTPHGYVFQNPNISSNKRKLFIFIEKILAEICTTKVIHVSKGEETEALKNNILSKDKSIVVYNGMDIPLNIESHKGNTFEIVTVARMDDQKNPWEAIRIVEGLIEKYPFINYTLIGDGKYYDEIVNYIELKKLNKNIKLPGFMGNPYDVLKKADLFLLTSLYEGLPYALIEAMAHKVPLLASNVTGNNELVINGENGFLYKLGSEQEGKDKVEELVNNPMRLQHMSNAAYNYFLSNFTIEKMIIEYEGLY